MKETKTYAIALWYTFKNVMEIKYLEGYLHFAKEMDTTSFAKKNGFWKAEIGTTGIFRKAVIFEVTKNHLNLYPFRF